MKLIIFVALCLATSASGYTKLAVEVPRDCKSCNPEECHPVSECVVGLVKDHCGCCDVCGKSELELCDHPEASKKNKGQNGICGENLECRLRPDLGPREPTEALCYCKDPDPVCGSNKQTYDNICQLHAESFISKKKIKLAKKGPCMEAPVIVSRPENVKNVTGSKIAMLCEAKGSPIPIIEWTWTRADGKVFNLPSDDLHISINMRGGPEKSQVTGWLQIMDLRKIHEGDYTCVAQNDHGFDKWIARVNVVDDKRDL